jgi:hypothetical protein
MLVSPWSDGALLVALVGRMVRVASEMGAAEGTGLLDGNPISEGVGLTVGLLNTDLSVPLPLGVDGKKGVPEGTGVIEGDSVRYSASSTVATLC